MTVTAFYFRQYNSVCKSRITSSGIYSLQSSVSHFLSLQMCKWTLTKKDYQRLQAAEIGYKLIAYKNVDIWAGLCVCTRNDLGYS